MKILAQFTWFVAITAGSLVLVGCKGSSSNGPIIEGLQPVHGKVLDADGKPVSGGWVTFKGSSAPGSVVKGEIGKDGTFTMETHTGPTKEAGVTAAATPYAGFVQLADGVTNYQLKKQFQVKAGDNDFTIQLTRDAHYP